MYRGTERLRKITLFNVQCTCTMYNVQCTMYNVLCSMYNVQCTMYMSDEQEGNIAHWKQFLQKHKKIFGRCIFHILHYCDKTINNFL